MGANTSATIPIPVTRRLAHYLHHVRSEHCSRQGFEVCGLYDNDPDVIGQAAGRLVVRSIDELPSRVKNEPIDIAIITVHGDRAQEVADFLAESGVKGVLNMSAAHVQSLFSFPVVDARITSCLNPLSHAIKSRETKRRRDRRRR